MRAQHDHHGQQVETEARNRRRRGLNLPTFLTKSPLRTIVGDFHADSPGIAAKATVNIGPFSRRGKGRTKTKAADHDFKPESTLTPFGIFVPQEDDLWLYMARSKIT
ncbi:MAG: hypothetical protein QOH87_2925, partial [Trebonia sp.]|nr:hypothetical protein [Trebonia sp.]